MKEVAASKENVNMCNQTQVSNQRIFCGEGDLLKTKENDTMYSKTCVKGPLKNRQNKDLYNNS